jgi:hypothetical protein
VAFSVMLTGAFGSGAGDCVFRSKVATHSGRNLPLIPIESCH